MTPRCRLMTRPKGIHKTKELADQIAAARASIASVAPVVRRRALKRNGRDEQDDALSLAGLAAAIRFLRTTSGMSQAELGKRIGRGLQLVSAIECERNWPSVEAYEGVCRVFRVGVQS